MTLSPSEPPQTAILRQSRLTRFFWQIVLIAHATLAVAWWWRQPSGFAISDRHFWVNSILPWVVVAIALSARFAHGRFGTLVSPFLLGCFPVAWIAAAISARLTFPLTFEWLWIPVLIVGLAMATVWLRSYWRELGEALRVALVAPALVGALLPLSQRGRPPGTLPINDELPSVAANTETVRFPRDIHLAPEVRINISEGSVWHEAGPYRLCLNPLLNFSSRSPDGCWVLFALPRERIGPQRFLRAIQQGPSQLELAYSDDDASVLRIRSSGESRAIGMEASSRFPKAIWSHLNSFSEILVMGHRKLLVSFSPCPDQRIEVKPMDYPAGRPERIAWLASGDLFQVVEAHSGEKGPYRQLATGTLTRQQPLSMTLYDEQTPIYRITFDDFAAQASTQPSPTGGYGAPENAIEFRLEGDDPASIASFIMTLASTSVGSGYDSVGHAAGTYRNRVLIEPLMPPPTTSTTTPSP